jgi:hypothetical protein
MRRILIAVTAATALSALMVVPAAAEVTCTGVLGATTIDDDVEVPVGASCSIDGTTIVGNVFVRSQATLVVDGAEIDGNIQADDGHASVTVTDTSLSGNIQLKQGGRADIRDTELDGDIQFDDNDGVQTVLRNRVGGNIQLFQNRAPLTVTGNRVGGNLQCQSNDPAPTGSGNVVEGDAEDQCAELTDAAPSFTDIAGTTHEAAIEQLYASGLVGGYADGTFRPARAVTRGQLASIIEEALALPTGPTTGLSDVAGTTHETGIRAVVNAGIASGFDDGTFRPDLAVSRGQAASIFAAAFELAAGSPTALRDVAGTTHEDGINAAVGAGLANGFPDGTFRPGDSMTRGQASTLFVEALAR